jgi:hypothetical protein
MHTLSCCVRRLASAIRRSFGASVHASRLPWDLCESLTERACSVGQRPSSSSVCIGRVALIVDEFGAVEGLVSPDGCSEIDRPHEDDEDHRLARATGAVHRPLPAAATLDVRRSLCGPSHRHRLPLISLAMPVMEVIPFSASGAGAALTAFGLALIARDGLTALFALIFTVTTGGLILSHVI